MRFGRGNAERSYLPFGSGSAELDLYGAATTRILASYASVNWVRF
ncbi:hypothetical protein JL2886_03460 [Phaeobacter gallaeciensis]|jgi:hypothetical protein|uniref:Uncharacterized protein n=1 Tax=Phaeobacter gallaeciensis TaxID=60890 RepID=A0A1B0ZVS7_9RHOB|nr:hypothetical protein JL2886_03460 [Phaeobacter gallaeciensis]